MKRFRGMFSRLKPTEFGLSFPSYSSCHMTSHMISNGSMNTLWNDVGELQHLKLRIQSRIVVTMATGNVITHLIQGNGKSSGNLVVKWWLFTVPLGRTSQFHVCGFHVSGLLLFLHSPYYVVCLHIWVAAVETIIIIRHFKQFVSCLTCLLLRNYMCSIVQHNTLTVIGLTCLGECSVNIVVCGPGQFSFLLSARSAVK